MEKFVAVTKNCIPRFLRSSLRKIYYWAARETDLRSARKELLVSGALSREQRAWLKHIFSPSVDTNRIANLRVHSQDWPPEAYNFEPNLA